MQAAPMARLQQKKQAAVTTGKAGATGIPCATVLTAASCSPWCAGLVSHHHPREMSRESLIPASGDRDHTTSPSAQPVSAKRLCRASASLVSWSRRVHRIPRPTFVTIAKRPSIGSGICEDNHSVLKNGSEIFFTKGLDINSD